MNKRKEDYPNLGIRFINFLIDTIVILFLICIVAFLFFNFFGIPSINYYRFFIIVLPIITFLSYYFFMENKLQKTVGKYITKTKVVGNKGNKAETNEIIKRSILRLIPLEQLSFLIMEKGIHDSISKTEVIKEN